MSDVILSLIKDPVLTYHQKVNALAHAAEGTLNIFDITPQLQTYLDAGAICDLFEGSAPYRPRYITMDFAKFMREGSEFLELQPPKDIWEATNNLMILYHHIPSITTFPVYVGNLDSLLEPFVKDVDEAYRAIKFLLLHIDRTITDSFCHANIGPHKTVAGELILKATQELNTMTPNITLKYDKDITPDDFATLAIETSIKVAKPSFSNDKMFRQDFDGDYAIASCYNGLNIGGGAYTLVRMNLARLAPLAKDYEDFMGNVLPDAIEQMAHLMDEKVRFLVEESTFFESSFLVREGFIDRKKFSGMFGMVGLAECVNHFVGAEKKDDRFGHSKKADDMGVEIVEKMTELVHNRPAKYCEITDGHYVMHAQVGIDTDHGISPGCRIPIGDEPAFPLHIKQTARFHKYFKSGIGDIFPFDETACKNPSSILDIIKGAFEEGMRYFSLYGGDADVIRITGYLVKKSEMDKLYNKEQVIQQTVVFGLGARENSHILERRVRGDE
ncbi:MAG: YjjI family glycine radical enzyme [Filifactor alocis]|nr:YjjI family glycine radical enzyme [Filifactor alocis]